METAALIPRKPYVNGLQIRHGLIWNDSRTVWSAVNACGFRKPNREAANSLS